MEIHCVIKDCKSDLIPYFKALKLFCITFLKRENLQYKSGSHLQKKCVICFTGSPLKVMKIFYFILKALFILKIFKFLSRLFGHVETARSERQGYFQNSWRHNQVNKQLQYTYCSISHEGKQLDYETWSINRIYQEK